MIFLAAVAIFAPVIAPHNPVQSDLRTAGKYRQAAWIETDNPKTTGDWSYPLGTDGNGRDVFSRLVYGTRISLVVGFIPDGGHHAHRDSRSAWRRDSSAGRSTTS